MIRCSSFITVFVDKVWADWQEVQKANNPDGTPHFAPLRDGPPGHNFGDVLKPWTRSVRDVLDISALGYGYEPSPSQPMIMAEASRAVRSRVRSPFWAD